MIRRDQLALPFIPLAKRFPRYGLFPPPLLAPERIVAMQKGGMVMMKKCACKKKVKK
tara:strand:+ start:2634 stop:2804 length:171 start_codon:yes stop_codon:yes gene_type:complete